MTGALVRPYINEDFSQVVEIAADLLASDRENAEKAIHSASSDDRFQIFVAQVEGKVVGLVVIEFKGWYRHLAEIDWIAVCYRLWRST